MIVESEEVQCGNAEEEENKIMLRESNNCERELGTFNFYFSELVDMADSIN